MSDRSGKKICPKRHWLRFSVRGLLLLVLLVSIPLGLIGRDLIRSKSEEYLVNDIQIADGYVRYDYVYQVMPPPGTMGLTIAKFDEHEPKGHWLIRKIFAKNIYSYVTYVSLRWSPDPNTILPRIDTLSRLENLTIPSGPLSDESIDGILRLRHLKELELVDTQIMPEQMRRLAAIDTLETLRVSQRAATDAVLCEVEHFHSLKEIFVEDATITDRALQAFGKLNRLNCIGIDNAQGVTDKGLKYLVNLLNLETLFADDTGITDQAVPTITQMKSITYLSISTRNPNVDFGEYRTYPMDPVGNIIRELVVMENFINLHTEDPIQPPPAYDPTINNLLIFSETEGDDSPFEYPSSEDPFAPSNAERETSDTNFHPAMDDTFQ